MFGVKPEKGLPFAPSGINYLFGQEKRNERLRSVDFISDASLSQPLVQ